MQMTGSLHRFANPARFQRLARAVLRWCACGSVLAFALGLYLALAGSPADYQQGDTVRIMYVHVPAAWMALGGYTLMALASAVAIIWKHRLGDIIAQSAAPVGAGFTVIALATGMLWGQPMWGTFWVWDARLTSVLVLLFLYLGYIALVHSFDDPERGARAGAILALVGWINVPIVKFSVDWWNTLHQPASISRFAEPALHPSILTPLLVMAVAFMLLFATLLLLRVRTAIIEHRLRTLAMAQARS
jgi:heme exporter protein C